MKIGIVVDNYKLEKFREELYKEGYVFTESVHAVKDKLTLITVMTVRPTAKDQIASITRAVELHFLKLKQMGN
jgi:outer membrane protein assembly factor BamA